jgi:hypothetical protein
VTLAPSLLLSLAACGQNNFDFDGSQVYTLFPFDGERTWEYISTDQELSYKLKVTSLLEPEVIDRRNVYTLDYTTECVRNDEQCLTGTVLYQLRWASTVTDGVEIHGLSVDGGQLQDLQPPVMITEDMAERDDAFVTETGGITWTSTLLGVEECPIAMNANWEECSKFEVVAEGGDGWPIAGTYWATKGNGIAAMELTGENGRWELSDIACEGECDGRW